MLRLRATRFPYLHLTAYLFYLAAALVITWPLATELSSRLIGHPFGDTYEYIHFVWWIKHALQTGQPVFFQPLLLYPNGIIHPPGLDLSLIWAMSLQSFPAWLLAFVLPQAGQVTFSGNLNADGRDVSLLLDGKVIQNWPVNGDLAILVPPTVNEAGYHTVSLNLGPPCVENETPALECRVLSLKHPALESTAPGAPNP